MTSFVYYGYLIVMSIAINILIVMMLIEMKKHMNTNNKEECFKLTRHFLFFNIPIFLQLFVIALKSLPLFGVTSPFFLSLLIEIMRIIVRCLIVVIICYNKTILKEFIYIIKGKKSEISIQSTELLEENDYTGIINEF